VPVGSYYLPFGDLAFGHLIKGLSLQEVALPACQATHTATEMRYGKAWHGYRLRELKRLPFLYLNFYKIS